jgi:carbon starvation protein
METLWIAAAAFVAFFVAYHTYGRWLARKVFQLDAQAPVPSEQLRDNVDFVPTHRQVIFGHHFTSIAGTGPIVGPAIAIFWGWLPALLWVVIGCIFLGAVHDFGALTVSLRNRGQTVGDMAGRLVAPRVKYLFLLILFFSLVLVLAVFGLVIATIFDMYPEAVLSVWVAMPVAVTMGIWVHRFNGKLLLPSLLALGVMYLAIYIGVYYLPFPNAWLSHAVSPVVFWTVILLAYCFVASVLPVWLLLQPRDYVNSHQLIVALGLLVLGVVVTGVTNQADINSAPAVVASERLPLGAPPIFPFLFITIACGAISGFHCLVSSGTSSKQLANERDAQYVGYGAMLMEGVLAVLVIIACSAGVGMGKYVKQPLPDAPQAYRFVPEMVEVDGKPQHLTGRAAWRARYDHTRSWQQFGLRPQLAAFVDGGGNLLASVGIPLEFGIGIIAVLVASFAATTLDTATRLHRYVIQELGQAMRFKPLGNKYAATGLAVTLGLVIAMIPAPGQRMGTGGLILWPLFGATNQLLAGLAFLVTFFYLWRRGRAVWFLWVPMCVMLTLPVWALLYQLFHSETGWLRTGQYHLFVIGLSTLALQLWMVTEALLMVPRVKNVLEEALPPLQSAPRAEAELIKTSGA